MKIGMGLDPGWDIAAPGFQAALNHAHDRTPLWAIRNRVANGELQFWHWPDAAFLTEVVDHPDAGVRTCQIYLATGTLEALQDRLPEIEKFARHFKCDVINIMGRKGWERSFLTRESGYRTVAVQYEKEL